MNRSSDAFEPHAGGQVGVSVTVTGTSANVAVPKSGGHKTVRLFNSGTNVVFVRFAPAADATALTTDMALAPNGVEVFSIPDVLANAGTLYVAAIAGSTGNTLYVTPGDGV